MGSNILNRDTVSPIPPLGRKKTSWSGDFLFLPTPEGAQPGAGGMTAGQ